MLLFSVLVFCRSRVSSWSRVVNAIAGVRKRKGRPGLPAGPKLGVFCRVDQQFFQAVTIASNSLRSPRLAAAYASSRYLSGSCISSVSSSPSMSGSLSAPLEGPVMAFHFGSFLASPARSNLAMLREVGQVERDVHD